MVARARLAELETGFTVEKSKVDAVQAALFKNLAEHYRKRVALRLVVSCRRKFLDSLLRGGEEEAEQTGAEFRQAKAQTEPEYDDTAAAMENKRELSEAEAGISVGLVTEFEGATLKRYTTLADIIGSEDHFGDMDFKLCGTREGVTGFQLDLKLPGVPHKIMTEAVYQARDLRMKILDIMNECIAAPRTEMSPYAPRIETIKSTPTRRPPDHVLVANNLIRHLGDGKNNGGLKTSGFAIHCVAYSSGGSLPNSRCEVRSR